MARFLLCALGVIALVFSAEIERTPALAAQHQSAIQSEPAQKPAIQEQRVALIIGNGAYVGANPLRNPPNDARAMSAALREIGFDVIERIDLNSREMKRAVIDFGNKLRSNDVGLFYYAGHGVQSNGKNYLIPVDAEIEKEADIGIDGIDLDTVMAQIEGAKNRLNIVILDACRNNFSTRGWSGQGRGLLQVANAPSGTFIAYATAPGSTASDNKSGQNGLYTQELLKALRQPGVRIEEAFKQVRLRVKDLSAGRQIPWESSSLEGEFYFIPTNSTVASSNLSSPSGGRTDNSPTAPEPDSDMLKNKPNKAINTDADSIPPPINPGRNWDSIQRKIDAGLHDDAIREGLDHLESHPNDPQLNWLLGLVHIKKGLFPGGFRYISKVIEGGAPVIFDITSNDRDVLGTLKVQKDGLEIQRDKTTTQFPYNLIRRIEPLSSGVILLRVGVDQNNNIDEKNFFLRVLFFRNYSAPPYDEVINRVFQTEFMSPEDAKIQGAWVASVFKLILDIKAKSQ